MKSIVKELCRFPNITVLICHFHPYPLLNMYTAALGAYTFLTQYVGSRVVQKLMSRSEKEELRGLCRFSDITVLKCPFLLYTVLNKWKEQPETNAGSQLSECFLAVLVRLSVRAQYLSSFSPHVTLSPYLAQCFVYHAWHCITRQSYVIYFCVAQYSIPGIVLLYLSSNLMQFNTYKSYCVTCFCIPN